MMLVKFLIGFAAVAKQSISFVDSAVHRVENYTGIHLYSDVPGTVVAEILADLLHYCRINDVDMDQAMRQAWGYVEEELSLENEIKGVESIDA